MFTLLVSVLRSPRNYHLSTCLCRWCRTAPKQFQFKEGKDFQVTLQQWETGAICGIVTGHGQTFCDIFHFWFFIWLSATKNKSLSMFSFIDLFERSQNRLQPFHVTIKTSSNSSFALCPSCAAVICNSCFLVVNCGIHTAFNTAPIENRTWRSNHGTKHLP